MAERSGCAKAVLWIVGPVLLVPGLCVLYLVNDAVDKSFSQYGTAALWIAAGIVVCGLVWLVIDFNRSPPDND